MRRLLVGLLPVLAGACDQAGEPQASRASDAPAAVQPSPADDGTLDLHAVLDSIARGEVGTATELEAKLDSDGTARVDIDQDGRLDGLRIVEKRDEVETTFEIRALPSSKTEVKVADAPTVARLQLHPDAEAGTVEASVGFTAAFSATAELDADARVTRTFDGLVADADGRLSVGAGANAFVAWTFSVGRPTYIADVFVVEVEPRRRDPCWPPGHCKHGHWKADGDGHGGVAIHVGGKGGKHGPGKHSPGKHKPGKHKGK